MHWFWHPNDEASLKSVSELLSTYDKTVGRGAQLMLGVAPDNRGLLPDSDVARLEEFGAALRLRAQNNLAAHHASPTTNVASALDNDRDTFWSAPSGSHHAAIEVDFGHPVTFDHTLTMEWLNEGQHVEKYVIEVWNEKDRAWKAIAHGEAIGHTRIDQFPAVTANRVRLNILSSTSEAHIREFQLYDWSHLPHSEASTITSPKVVR
jgi:alpha-L-fucosidase